jgi:hypothetical protein
MDDLQRDPPLGRRRPRLLQDNQKGHVGLNLRRATLDEMSEQQGARFSHGSTQKKHHSRP